MFLSQDCKQYLGIDYEQHIHVPCANNWDAVAARAMLIVLTCLVDTTVYRGGFQDRALATDVDDTLTVAPGVVNRSTWRI